MSLVEVELPGDLLQLSLRWVHVLAAVLWVGFSFWLEWVWASCVRTTDPESERAPDWAPVVRTFAGIWQVEPDWVHAHLSEVTVVDVREVEEVRASPLGSIAGSILIPLGALRDRAADVPRGKPVVTTCPAGARSAHAAKVLEKAGIEQVANLRGGMFEWRALGFPIEGKKKA